MLKGTAAAKACLMLLWPTLSELRSSLQPPTPHPHIHILCVTLRSPLEANLDICLSRHWQLFTALDSLSRRKHLTIHVICSLLGRINPASLQTNETKITAKKLQSKACLKCNHYWHLFGRFSGNVLRYLNMLTRVIVAIPSLKSVFLLAWI